MVVYNKRTGWDAARSIFLNTAFGALTGGLGGIKAISPISALISEFSGIGLNAILAADVAIESENDYPNINKITKGKDYIEIINYMDNKNSSCKK